MVDQRQANGHWFVADADGRVPTWDRVQVAVLMDLRDRLDRLLRILECRNFLEIPSILRKIATAHRPPKSRPKKRARKSVPKRPTPAKRKKAGTRGQ